jgi:hypothetical protein
LRGTETILVVEDDETVRTPTLRALRRLGYTVLEAAGSRDAQAISLANPGVIDLLLTDIVMPEMDGRALATLLLQDRPSMRVAFISGYAPPCDASESFVGPIIEKPFSPRLLGERVRAILDAEDGEVRDGYGCGSSATTRNC